ncbi:hypothetical protein FACUT_14206, partial [Fusarium acutatum]
MLRNFINAPPAVTSTIPVTTGQASGVWVHSALVNPEAYLANNRDGVIVLKDTEGAEVHRVSYSSNVPLDDGSSFGRLGVHCRVYGKKFKVVIWRYATGNIQVKPDDNDVTYYRPGSGEI